MAIQPPVLTVAICYEHQKRVCDTEHPHKDKVIFVGTNDNGRF